MRSWSHWNSRIACGRSYTGRGNLVRSARCAIRRAALEADLGRDEGRETALLHEAHLDGCRWISINWPCGSSSWYWGDAPGRARRWREMGVDGEVESKKLRVSAAPPRHDPRVSAIIETSTSRLHASNISHSTPTMSTLPRSIAARLLAPALRPSAARVIAPAYRPYSTKDSSEPERQTSTDDAPSAPVNSKSTQIREESASQGMGHAPDYNVAVDYRTSCAPT
jgi:hypothetical protein